MRAYYLIILLFIIACSNNNDDQTIYNGRLETDVIRLSAKIAGEIDSLQIEEGDPVAKNQILALINKDKLLAQRRQQQAQLVELTVNLQAVDAQARQVQAQLDLASQTLAKTELMLKEGAATEQKRDELATQVDVLTAQKDGLKSNRQIISSKIEQLRAAQDITELNIQDARIISPIDGIIINKYHYKGELITPGMAVVDLANISSMEATIYIPLEELNKVKLGQIVKLTIDGVDKEFEGKVRWVSSESEFTPKTILTKETRTTLVYSVKIAVSNPDGIFKIGMPVDVKI
ncbi:MAG: HlyD family secretion protein [Calditrichaceae bacterium]